MSKKAINPIKMKFITRAFAPECYNKVLVKIIQFMYSKTILEKKVKILSRIGTLSLINYTIFTLPYRVWSSIVIVNEKKKISKKRLKLF